MNYTPVEQRVIKYCQENANSIYDDSINTLAEKVYTSPSTISKLSRKMGYNSFIEFKIDHQMKYGLSKTESSVNDFILNYLEEFKKSITNLNLSAVVECKQMLIESDEIILFGIGSSAQTARYLKNNLLRLSLNAIQENNFYSNTMQLHTRSQTKRLVLVLFSHSGNTSEILQSLDDVDTDLFKIITFTSDRNSKLAKLSDLVIDYEIETGDRSPFSNWSYIVQIALCDILLNELTRDITPNNKLNSQ